VILEKEKLLSEDETKSNLSIYELMEFCTYWYTGVCCGVVFQRSCWYMLQVSPMTLTAARALVGLMILSLCTIGRHLFQTKMWS